MRGGLSPQLRDLVTEAWSETSGLPPSEAATFVDTAGLVVTGTGGSLPSSFLVEDVALACVATALVASSTLTNLRRTTAPNPTSGPAIELDRDHVCLAVRSERYFSVAGRPAASGFAALSRFWRAADGWVRTHGNYPWHRAALAGALGTDEDPESIASAIRQSEAEQLEELVFAAGGIAAMVRSETQWQEHPQGKAVAAEPLVARSALGEDSPREPSPLADAELPAQGLRVLDLTRVIAGPVCSRYLGALGADVLRLDPPTRPDMEKGSVADTLVAKRSALMDLATRGALDTLHELLDAAHVVVCGYRPGALEHFGLDPGSLAERHRGLVVVYLDAWGHDGPWARRRGFDSIVQAACGIAASESADGETPGALPCQLLDHGTGFLAGAAALEGLCAQAERGGTQVRRLSLARTARWLMSSGAPASSGHAPVSEDPSAFLEHLGERDATGPVAVISPPGTLSGRALSWQGRIARYGKDTPEWEIRP